MQTIDELAAHISEFVPDGGKGYVQAERFRPVVEALRKALAWMEGAQNSHIDSATRGLLACEIVEVHKALALARELLPES